jgi:NAD(P)-dependent dehydrogenase (short-subunit alcohol dehydrogenase family)
MRRFEGKVVLVTGAASGIGRATAERLASEGASLFLVDVSKEGLEETVKRCQQGAEAAVECASCDVAREEQVNDAVARCIDRFGRLDVLVNVAGILLLEHAHETTLAQWQKVLDVNLTGTFLFCRAALPHLLASGGNIVNTSSTSALAGMPYGAAYGASKAGVLALTRALAVEYGAKGVRVNAICPGSIKTPMGSGSNLPKDVNWELLKRAMPLDKPRGPEVVASVVAMLASADGAHVNGESIRMDGGTLA